VKPSDIILLGRSIGSGPATEMASLYNPSALILISAFTSLQEVIIDQIGYSIAKIVKDRFNNKHILEA
jgi:hypothetical protein